MFRTNELKNKRILVTGGAGFIGSNLCEELLKLGAYVRCLDNLSTGSYDNIIRLIDNHNFDFINSDIRNLDDCRLACKSINYVLHNAALGSVPRSIKNPGETNDVNASGFINILIASNEQNIKRVIFASSSSVYGDSLQLPKIENEIGNPLSPYAITKFMNELYAKTFYDNYKLDFIGLRYFNVFGGNQNIDGPYAAVIPIFIKNLINHKSPTINGDGTISRDFTYVDNIIQMNILSILTNKNNSINQIYNVGCGHKTTILDLFNLLKVELSKFDKKISKINPIFGPERKGDIQHSYASIYKAVKLLDYKPKYDIGLGLSKTVNWFWKNSK